MSLKLHVKNRTKSLVHVKTQVNLCMEHFYETMKMDLRKMGPQDTFCIYIDFPFCASVCRYCAYNTVALKGNEDKRKEYVTALINQIRNAKEILELKIPDSIYFGGGTPSLFTCEELRLIKNCIPNYSKIKTKKIEAHPIDLTPQMIEFYAKEMHIDVVSLGVQSLNHQSCLHQKRVWVDAECLREVVEMLHSWGIFVNTDFVALFDGDEPSNWEIFNNDIQLAITKIKPDIITCVVNYFTKAKYSEQVLKLRQIIADWIGGMYYPANKKMLSTNMFDIEQYRNNDHWIATKKYWDYQRNSSRYNGSKPQLGKGIHQATLAFGGANKHTVYSFPTSVHCICMSRYDFTTHTFSNTIEYLI